MKYVKILGLAAVAAMSLMGFGAGTASATKLCTESTDPCPAGKHEPIGTEVHWTLTSGSSLVIQVGETILLTCTASTVRGKTISTAATGSPVNEDIEYVDFTNCSRSTEVLSAGNGVVHDAAGSNGTLTWTGTTEITFNTIFGTCVYGTGTGLNLGTVKGGNPATLNINTGIPKISGNFACPATAVWKADYVMTKPAPIYITHN